MRMRRLTVVVALVVMGALSLGVASSASANLKKEFETFKFCPYENPLVVQCVYSTTTGGEFHLGSKTVPVEPKVIVLQGGLTHVNTELIPATNGETVSKTPLVLPGGLVGIELLPPLTEVTATAEPVGPINVNVNAVSAREGTAVSMPLRVKLDNPALGAGCFVGSAGEPISLNLTTGTTSPPPPNEPISGNPGKLVIAAAGKIGEIAGSSLVDNSFSAPGAQGCGGPLIEAVVDPGVDLDSGLPSASGKNTAILNGGFKAASSGVVKAELALPVIGHCVKEPAEKENGMTVYHGLYVNSGCTFEIPSRQGKYEWVPGPGTGKAFTTEGKTATLETIAKAKVKCLESHGSGEYTGTKTATFSTTFTGCELTSTKEACQSSGQGSGTVVANGLQGELGFVEDKIVESNQAVVLGWDLMHEPTVISAECGVAKEALTVTGSVVAPLSAINKMLPSYTLKLKASGGLQLPEGFEEEAKDTLSATIGSIGPEQAGLTSAIKVNNSEKLEIKGQSE
jgi:hypothetical protein